MRNPVEITLAALVTLAEATAARAAEIAAAVAAIEANPRAIRQVETGLLEATIALPGSRPTPQD